jgi:hypothetical protein
MKQLGAEDRPTKQASPKVSAGSSDDGNGTAVIVCRNVWKIYGCDIQQSLAAIKDEGIGKAEVFGRFECVVAVAHGTVGQRQIYPAAAPKPSD